MSQGAARACPGPQKETADFTQPGHAMPELLLGWQGLGHAPAALQTRHALAASLLSTRPQGPAFVNASGRRSDLAPAASSPGRAAASPANCAANSAAKSQAKSQANCSQANSATSAASAATASAANANANAASAANANAASAASAASAAAAATGFLYQAPKRSRVLLIEDVERRQADVGHFLFTERDFVTRCHVRCRRSVRCRHG